MFDVKCCCPGGVQSVYTAFKSSKEKDLQSYGVFVSVFLLFMSNMRNKCKQISFTVGLVFTGIFCFCCRLLSHIFSAGRSNISRNLVIANVTVTT